MHSMILIFYHEVMYFLLLDVVSMMGRLLHHLVQDRCQMFVVVKVRTCLYDCMLLGADVDEQM